MSISDIIKYGDARALFLKQFDDEETKALTAFLVNVEKYAKSEGSSPSSPFPLFFIKILYYYTDFALLVSERKPLAKQIAKTFVDHISSLSVLL
jgi:hypothetical protein